MTGLATRVLTGIALGLVVAGAFLLHVAAPAAHVPWATATTLALLSAWELARMRAFSGLRLGLPLGLAACGVAAIAVLGDGAPAARFWTGYGAAGFLVLAVWLGRRILGTATRPDALTWTLALALWSVVPLHGLGVIDAWWGTSGLVSFVLLAKIGDVFGYFVGRSIGRRHPFPRISPNKTVAGCVASFVAGIVCGGVLAGLGYLPVGARGWPAGALAGCLVNGAAQAGDLLESWVKRRAGVKDSSPLFGPAGGVLDVVDSLQLSLPFALAAWPFLFPAG